MLIRPATLEDLDDLEQIFDESAAWMTARYRPDQVGSPPPGQGERSAFYRHLQETGGVFVATDPDPVGFSAAILRDEVWFLSQLWVLPDRHGRGAGSRLLNEALDWGRAARAFSVVASPFPVAQAMYLRASMYPLWTQVDLVGKTGSIPQSAEVAPLSAEDQAWVDELDAEVRGTRRPEDHAFWREAARGLVLRRGGRPVGFAYVWAEGKIGPAAANDAGDLPAVLDAALGSLPAGTLVSVAVPSSNWTGLRHLIARGLAPVGSNTFMASGPLGDATRYVSSGGGLG